MGRERSNNTLAHADILAKVGARTFEVFLFLIKHARSEETLVTAKEIADALDFSRVSAHKHLRRLADAGYVTSGEWVTREDGSRCVSRRLCVGGLQGGLHCPYISSYEISRLSSSFSPRCRAGEAEGITDCKDMDPADFVSLIEDLNDTAPRKSGVDLSLLPPYPTPSVCPLIRYPNQPLLPTEEVAAVKMMIRAFKAMTHKVYGKTPRVDRKAIFRLRPVRRALTRNNFRNPWAWCAYRMNHWLSHDDKNKAPGVDWIWNTKAVDKFAGAFKATSARYEHLGKVGMTPAHQELLRRWQNLYKKIGGISGVNSQVASELRDEILPADTYERLRKLSEEQRGVQESDLYAQLANGRWIW